MYKVDIWDWIISDYYSFTIQTYKKTKEYFYKNMIAFEKSIGAVIFRKTEEGVKYLLLDYGKMKNGNDYWGFVKGHTEKGETEEGTMRREVLEETGISDLKIVSDFCDDNRYFYRAYGEEREKRKKSGRKTFIAKKAIYLLAETRSEKVKLSDEHIDFSWLSLREAIKKLTHRSSQKTLKKADKFLERSFRA